MTVNGLEIHLIEREIIKVDLKGHDHTLPRISSESEVDAYLESQKTLKVYAFTKTHVLPRNIVKYITLCD